MPVCVQEQSVYQWILSDFSFDDDSKNDVKDYQGTTTY
jgi:hypothetical protein